MQCLIHSRGECGVDAMLRGGTRHCVALSIQNKMRDRHVSESAGGRTNPELAGEIKTAHLSGEGHGDLRFLLGFERSKKTKFGDSRPFVCSPKKQCLEGQIRTP